MNSTASLSGIVITFYSYKGGAGRSMALANTAYLISQHLKGSSRAIMLDWDLEAPGLHTFFAEKQEQFDTCPGVIDYFHALQKLLKETRGFYKKITATEGWKVLDEVLPLENYLIHDIIPGVDFIKAGLFDSHYSELVGSFNWIEFYNKFGSAISVFKDLLTFKYAYTLVDSRTGLTDTSGICTMLLPEKLVTVFTPNDQSLVGVLDLVDRAISYRRSSNDFRPLAVFPLPSRIEIAEKALREQWRKNYQSRFEEIFRRVYDVEDCDLTEYFDEVQLPHVSYYAYGEKIAVEEERSEALSLSRAYREFFRRLIELDAAWAKLADIPSIEHLMPIEYIDIALKFSGTGFIQTSSLSGETIWHLTKLQSFLSKYNSDDEISNTTLGQELFQAVFRAGINSTYLQYLNMLQDNQRLRLSLDFSQSNSEIAALPWELLNDPNQGPLVLFDTPIARYIPAQVTTSASVVEGPLKVLLTSANPEDYNRFIDFEKELSSIQLALAELGEHVKITVEPHLSAHKLQKLLRSQSFHIWHFTGHMFSDAEINKSSLIFEDENSNSHPIEASHLSVLLNKSHFRLAVLGVHESRNLRFDFSHSIADAFIHVRIPTVVTMRQMSNAQAINVFMKEFYRVLVEGLPIESCMTEGRKAIVNFSGLERADWASPILYTSLQKGKLFELPPFLSRR